MKNLYIANIKHSFNSVLDFDEGSLLIADSQKNLEKKLFAEIWHNLEKIYDETPWSDLKFAFDTLEKLMQVCKNTGYMTVDFSIRESTKVGDLVVISEDFCDNRFEYGPDVPIDVGEIGIVTEVSERGWASIKWAKGQSHAPITCIKKYEPTEDK